MILVTGGTGLVGSHLLRDLAESGEKVRALYRSEESLRNVKKVFRYKYSEKEADIIFSQIEWVQADITDVPSLENAFPNIEVVYHCAALVSFDNSNDALLRRVNIEGTANIVNFCVKNRVRKLCFVSSIATHDKKPGQEVITEDSHWNKEINHSMYAITKYGAEMEVWRGSQEGVPVVIVNPGVIIGPGYWDSGSGKIFKKLHQGLKYYIPKTTGFVGVEDVVKIMRELMSSPVANENYILVAENLSFQTILEMTASHLGKPAPSKKLKPWMVVVGWIGQQITSLFSKKERLLNYGSRKSFFENSFYSSDKIQHQLNYKFQPLEKVIEQIALKFSNDRGV